MGDICSQMCSVVAWATSVLRCWLTHICCCDLQENRDLRRVWRDIGRGNRARKEKLLWGKAFYMLVKNGTKPFMAEAKPFCNKKLDETRKLLASEDVKNDQKELNKVQFKFNVLIKVTKFLINAARAQFHACERNEGSTTQRQRRMEKDDGGGAKKEKGDEKDDQDEEGDVDEEGDDEEDGDEKSGEDVVVTGGQDEKGAIFVDEVVDHDDVEFFKSRSSDRGGTKNQKDLSSMLRHLDECEQVLKTNYPKWKAPRAVHLGDVLDIVGEDCWGTDAFIMLEYDANEIEKALALALPFKRRLCGPSRQRDGSTRWETRQNFPWTRSTARRTCQKQEASWARKKRK